MDTMDTMDSNFITEKYQEKFTNHIFKLCLKMIKLPDLHRNIYICCDRNDKYIEKFAHNLLLSSVPKINIYYQKWMAPPGGKLDNFQFIDKALKDSEIVLLVGSTYLFSLSDYIRCGIEEKIIIPIWFEGNFNEIFPGRFQVLPGQSFMDNYYDAFFKLMVDLYKLDPIDNQIYDTRDKFYRLLQNQSMYNEFVENEIKRETEDNNEIMKMLGI